MAATSPFYDLERLLALRSVIRDLNPLRPPSLRQISSPSVSPLRRLALLPGSFNPLTDAHVAMADAALSSGRIDALDYLIATRTTDKERVERASLADRLICLDEYVQGKPSEGVVLVNRGLYVHQAEIAWAAMPSLQELWFVVGFDKIVQIFDPRYYSDRDAALDRLFALASFLVAPRDAAGVDALAEFLARPENRRYATKVRPFDLPVVYRRLSSTHVRDEARHGEVPTTEVPPIVVEFVRETGAYDPALPGPGGDEIDRYGLRELLIAAVEQGQLPVLPPTEFRRAVERLCEPGPEGRRRREELRRGNVAAATQDDREGSS